jgi:hypothetical protein
MKINMLFILMAVMLWGIHSSGWAAADHPSIKQVVFYVQ